MRRMVWVVVVALACWGCSGHVPPNAAPETKIAIYATDALTGVREIQRMVVEGKLIREDQAASVMMVALRIGQAGEQVSRGLSIYHSAKDLSDKQLALRDIYKRLDEIDANLKILLRPIDDTGTKAKFLDVVMGVVRNYFAVRTMLPALGGAS